MQASGDLVLDVRVEGTACVVRLTGAVGMAEACLLEEQLDQLVQNPNSLVVLDLSQLDFLCSSGLGALIGAHAKARPYEGQLRLAGPNSMVKRLLETTRLNSLFGIYATVEEALEL